MYILVWDEKTLSGYTNGEYNGLCFSVSRASETWSYAMARCMGSPGGKLAAVRSMEDYRRIREIVG